MSTLRCLLRLSAPKKNSVICRPTLPTFNTNKSNIVPKASRQQVQEVGSNAIAMAMCSANNQEVISLDPGWGPDIQTETHTAVRMQHVDIMHSIAFNSSAADSTICLDCKMETRMSYTKHCCPSRTRVKINREVMRLSAMNIDCWDFLMLLVRLSNSRYQRDLNRILRTL